MTGFTASDISVVIPTRDRWDILLRTLEGLDRQSVTGFEIVVVVDGIDQQVPQLGEARIVQVEHRGPGAARNAGARAATKPIVIFLGDDMVPDSSLVKEHLATHVLHTEEEVAVLGLAKWHPEVARGRINRWMDASGTQFDFGTISGDEAGFGHFYSCNVSLKRAFFLGGGGFDEDFTYYYEDLDCGWRLEQKGMRLLYRPEALSFHLHRYDMAALESRFQGVAAGEHLMASKHAWFRPFFLDRVRAAVDTPAAHFLWPLVVDVIPARALKTKSRARDRTDAWYYRALGEDFLAGWAAADDLAELHEYLGEQFDQDRLVGHQQEIEAERATVPDETTFYRTSEAYLYDLTVFAMSDTKSPYLAELRSALGPRATVLDYGCGIGADGLRLAAGGYEVSFADFTNPSTTYLRWRLKRRGIEAPVYDVETDAIPTGFDAAYAFDVIEHVDDPFDFLARLERHARLVVVNLLEEEPEDIELHRPLPIRALLDHANKLGLVRYRRYHDRSHLLIYRSQSGPSVSRVRSSVQRRVGARLKGMPGWHPIPQI